MNTISGPYWVRTATNGKHQVCGRNGATIREYMPDQIAMADADCRKLQAGYAKAERAIRDAAPDLFEALKLLVDSFDTINGEAFISPPDSPWSIARTALAKAAPLSPPDKEARK